MSEQWEIVEGEALSVLSGLSSGSFDALITDPPYSSGGLHSTARKGAPSKKYQQSGSVEMPHFGGDNRDQRSFLLWCTLWLSECLRIVRPGGICVVFADWRQLPIMTDAIQAGGWTWRGLVPWVKPGARPYSGRMTAACEYAIWGSNGGLADIGSSRASEIGVLPGFHEILEEPADLPSFYRTPPVGHAKRSHMTEKPVDLMRALARAVLPGERILDPFAGSGSTLVGALLEGRRAVGIEREAHYADVARSRCREAALSAIGGGR